MIRLAAILVLVAASAAQAHITIALRGTVRLLPDAPVTLGDIARIERTTTEQHLHHTATDLARIVIAPSIDALPAAQGPWHVVEASRVRAVLAAHPSLNLGRITLSGDTVYLSNADANTAPSSVTGANEDNDPRARPEPVLLKPATGTVGASLLATLATTLDLTPDRLRVTFNESDRDTLDEPLRGRTATVRPTGIGSRTPFAITFYENDRVINGGTVTVNVAVRHRAATLSSPIRRGDPLPADAFTVADTWLSPTDLPADPATLSGRIARRTLHPGHTLLDRDTEPATAIERGDIVMVHSVTRSVVVALKARALADACEGDLLMLELQATRERVQARASGPGTAILTSDLVPADTQQAPAPPEPTR